MNGEDTKMGKSEKTNAPHDKRMRELFDFDKILYADSAKEVDGMLADVIANAKNYERNIRKEEKKEMARKMLLKNKPISEIMEFTELTEKQIREIEKTI